MENIYERLNGGLETDLSKILSKLEFDLSNSISLFTRSKNPANAKICSEIEKTLFAGHPNQLCDEYTTAVSALEMEIEMTSFLLGLKLGITLAK
jgi:hypothetical protein